MLFTDPQCQQEATKSNHEGLQLRSGKVSRVSEDGSNPSDYVNLLDLEMSKEDFYATADLTRTGQNNTEFVDLKKRLVCMIDQSQLEWKTESGTAERSPRQTEIPEIRLELEVVNVPDVTEPTEKRSDKRKQFVDGLSDDFETFAKVRARVFPVANRYTQLLEEEKGWATNFTYLLHEDESVVEKVLIREHKVERDAAEGAYLEMKERYLGANG